MTREYAQQKQVVCDLFGRDSGGCPTAYDAAKADKNTAAEETATEQSEDNKPKHAERCAKVKPQFSEDLWEDALKRHCDARQNLRSLLDRYIKPHH